jgi:FHA domain
MILGYIYLAEIGTLLTGLGLLGVAFLVKELAAQRFRFIAMGALISAYAVWGLTRTGGTFYFSYKILVLPVVAVFMGISRLVKGTPVANPATPTAPLVQPLKSASYRIAAPVALSNPVPVTAAVVAAPTSIVVNRPLSAKLSFSTATGFVADVPLSGPTLVGRSDAERGRVDIDLSSFPGGERISRQHARITPGAGGWILSDCGSANGVSVKSAHQPTFTGRMLQPTQLHHGDMIAFGEVIGTFQLQ